MWLIRSLPHGQSARTSLQPNHQTPRALDQYAEMIDLDMRRFKAEMAERIYTQRVHEHRRSGELIGLAGRPLSF